MYITAVPNRNSPPAILLRESYRHNGKVKTRTLANLSKLPPHAIDVLRRSLKGQTLLPPDQAFEITASFQHGNVQTLLEAIKRLGLANMISSRPSRQRDLALALIVARLLKPNSKLATTRWWHQTTLPQVLKVSDASHDELYQAMDWLLQRQPQIQKKLAARHLKEDCIALYDLTSSYFEGTTCPLAFLGHNRDGKKGKLQVNYGLLTDQRGCPVSVSVFEGNTADSKTLLEQIQTSQKSFGIGHMVIVGDRGMITQKQIKSLRAIEGMDWITALRTESIRKLVEGETIQMGLFDERNLFEFSHPDFPGERLVACRNLELAQRRANKRHKLIEATAAELTKVKEVVQGKRLRGKKEITKRVQSVLCKYRIGKLYHLEVGEEDFEYRLDEKEIEALAAAHGKGNPERIHTCLALYKRHLEAIEDQLEKVHHQIKRGRLYGKDQIGLRVGKVLNKFKVGKHFKLDIQDDRFDFALNEEKITAEAALDGIYVIRTSLPQSRMKTEDAVRSYKMLSQVERAFRSLKTIDLEIRPIYHRLEDRVRAHIFLCMLSYYVQWHLIEAWRPLLFADEDQESKATRDPIKPAQRSRAARKKATRKVLEDGSLVHSFQTLLDQMSGIVRNVCRAKTEGEDSPTFDLVTTPNAKQQKALDLLKTIQV